MCKSRSWSRIFRISEVGARFLDILESESFFLNAQLTVNGAVVLTFPMASTEKLGKQLFSAKYEIFKFI